MTKTTALRSAAVILTALLILTGGGPAALNSQSGRGGEGLSRPMEHAIRLYHEGQDSEAMERFMDILADGSPGEKSLANQYISKITLRMQTGSSVPEDRAKEGAGSSSREAAGVSKAVSVIKPVPPPVEKLVKEEEVIAVKPEVVAKQEGLIAEEKYIAQEEVRSEKERTAQRIAEKIAAMRRAATLALSKHSFIRIYADEKLPAAITIKTAALFAGETAFKPDAASALSSMAGLFFTLSKAGFLIIPEGTVHGDVKIKSIRQALALSSYLVSRGVSPSRINVNLTGSDIQVPKELGELSGLIILIDHDKKPRLMKPADERDKAPKVSLGVYPTAISVDKEEGAIVEFSVFESAGEKPSWKLEIFSVQPDNSAVSLQKIEGSAPQYGQTYWNGRKNFSGLPYPSGKYMFSVTATDSGGGETNLRRLLFIRPGPNDKKAPAAAVKPLVESKELVKASPAKTVKGGKVPIKKGKAALNASARVKAGAAAKTGVKPGRQTASGPEKKYVKKSVAREETADEAGEEPSSRTGTPAASSEPQTEFSAQVSYKIYFREGTAIVTPNSEKKLAQVSETLNYYHMARIKLIGYAYSGEANSETMAQNRVNYVATRLTSKYKIEKERMDISTQISDAPKSIVEIKMLGRE